MTKYRFHNVTQLRNINSIYKINVRVSLDGWKLGNEMKKFLTEWEFFFNDRRWNFLQVFFNQSRRPVFQINSDPNILPNVKLVMRWSDTRGETVEATKAMIDMICEGVAAFFGPEGSCYVEAIVAQSRNIPMISYVSSFNNWFETPAYPAAIHETGFNDLLARYPIAVGGIDLADNSPAAFTNPMNI